MKNTLSATFFLSALILLSVFTLSTCGLPEGLEKSDCGKKSNVDCDGPYLRHYDPESQPIRKLSGINRWYARFNPSNNNELLFVKKTPDSRYDLVIYNTTTKSEKTIFSANSVFSFQISNFGVISIPFYNKLFNLKGKVIKEFDERKFGLYAVEAFSPVDSNVFYAYYMENQFIQRWALYDFVKDSLIRDLNWSYQPFWKSQNECYVLSSQKLFLFDCTYSYDKPKEIIFDFSTLPSELYFINDPSSAELFDGNLLSLHFGVNLININHSTITKINNDDCHKVKIEHAIWDKINNKILFIKNVVKTDNDHNYVSENSDLYQMDMDGCNERRYFE